MATVRIPTPLRKFTQGQDMVRAEAATVGELISILAAAHPGLGERLLDEKGQMRRFVNIFVGAEDVRFLQNLDTPLPKDAEVSIVPAIAGGSAGR